MKARRSKRPSALPVFGGAPTMGPRVGPALRPGGPPRGAGRLGPATRDAEAMESTAAPRTKPAASRAVARSKNEVGRVAAATVGTGSRRATLAKKPPEGAFKPPARQTATNPAASPPLGRGTKKGPRVLSNVKTHSQEEAKAAAKDSQIRRAGIQSRRLGHLSATVKRAQARRDSKG